MEQITVYLILHAATTIAALIGFLIRNENRLTKTETTLALLHQEHVRIVTSGKHPGRDN